MGSRLPLLTRWSRTNSNFEDHTLLFFVAGMLTFLSAFNIGLLKLNGFLNSDGSVQEQPTE